LSNQQSQDTKETAEANDFHVYFKPGTADWLRRKRNRNAKTVPAVVREIVEEAERRDKQKSRR
jgi:hypothetical protein